MLSLNLVPIDSSVDLSSVPAESECSDVLHMLRVKMMVADSGDIVHIRNPVGADACCMIMRGAVRVVPEKALFHGADQA